MLQDVMKNISKMPQIEFPLYSFVSDNMIFVFLPVHIKSMIDCKYTIINK